MHELLVVLEQRKLKVWYEVRLPRKLVVNLIRHS
jgi:hypothetical protein